MTDAYMQSAERERRDRHWVNALLALDPTDLSHARRHRDFVTDIHQQRYYRIGRVHAASGVSAKVILGEGGWAKSIAIYADNSADPDDPVRTIPA